MLEFEPIVACITGAQRAAVAIVRVSGAGSLAIAAEVFPAFNPVPVLQLQYGRFAHGDDGFAVVFDSSRGFTGEESAEFFIHGSTASVSTLLDLCVQAGARRARPGEFTLRAFLHGRLDLSQAEAVRDTVESETQVQLAHANLMRAGALNQATSALRERLLGVLASVEAHTDFSDELGEFDGEFALLELLAIYTDLSRLAQSQRSGRLIREGAVIAIVGKPNAGKSSLLNAVVRSDRAIVHSAPGTTRDTIEERVEIHGLLCRLVDTAGLRESDESIESLGIERARFAAQNADLVWYVFDASVGWDAADNQEWTSFEGKKLLVSNKTDLAATERGLQVSAKTGKGLPELLQATAAELGNVEASTVHLNDRQAAEAERALESVGLAIRTLEHALPTDLLAVALKEAIATLDSMLGQGVTPDVLDSVFARFCIGK